MDDTELQELQSERKRLEEQLDESGKIKLEQEKIAALKKQLKTANPPAYYKFASAFVSIETRLAKKAAEAAKILIKKEIEKAKRERAERQLQKVV